jgi:hypothetical protein
MEIEMKKRVGIFFGGLGSVPDSYLMSTAVLLGVVGRNSGNLAFQYAVNRHIASAKTPVGFGSDPSWVRERCDVLVIPSSNQVNPVEDSWVLKAADFIEAADLPCIAVGLGAQAATLHDEIKLSDGTLRYLQAISSHSEAIGVRGDYTASVLSKYGIKNTVVIGCPSNFLHPSPTLGATIEQKISDGHLHRLVMTDIERRIRREDLDRKLFDWIVQSHGTYVCQSDPVLTCLARGRREEASSADVERMYRWLVDVGAHENHTAAPSLDSFANYFRAFFDIGAWLEFLSGYDLSIGVRFHGNLLAIQAGIPGLCIAHDARTQELCTTTALPCVSIEQVMNSHHVQDIVHATSFDGAVYDARRTSLSQAYRNLFIDCGVQVTDNLNKLATSREECLTKSR